MGRLFRITIRDSPVAVTAATKMLEFKKISKSIMFISSKESKQNVHSLFLVGGTGPVVVVVGSIVCPTTGTMPPINENRRTVRKLQIKAISLNENVS